MNLTSQHVTGFIVGVGFAAAAYYAYQKNQPQIDDFLRRQGIQLPNRSVKDRSVMTLEELVTDKELLEDLIAEREMAEKQQIKSKK